MEQKQTINKSTTAGTHYLTEEEILLLIEQSKKFQKIMYENPSVRISGSYSEEVKATQFETLYLSLKNTVDYIDKEVVEIYNIVDKLSGIPFPDKVTQEVPYNESQKIIPAFQEEVLKLEEIKDVLSIIKQHLQTVV